MPDHKNRNKHVKAKKWKKHRYFYPIIDDKITKPDKKDCNGSGGDQDVSCSFSKFEWKSAGENYGRKNDIQNEPAING